MTELWQAQAADPAAITLDDIHRLAAAMRQAVRRRNRLGLMIVGVELVVFGGMWLAYPDPVRRLGCLMTLAGLLYMGGQLLGRPAAVSPERLGLAACVEHEIAELSRQRDFHRGWWFWSRLVCFVPGPLVFAVGSARAFPDQALGIGIVAGIFISIAVWAIPLNLRLARSYQRRIDRLRAAQRG